MDKSIGTIFSKEIDAILREGSSGKRLSISKRNQLQLVMDKLQPAFRAQPRLLSLLIADPRRLLKAVGIELDDSLVVELDSRTHADSIPAAPEKYEQILNGEITTGTNLRVGTSVSPKATAGIEQSDFNATGLDERLQSLSNLAQAPTTNGSLTPSRLTPLVGSVGTAIRPDEIERRPPPPLGSERLPCHEVEVDFNGTTGGWDVVLQLHENYLQNFYDAFLAAQAFGSGLGGGTTDFIDHTFTFESWLFLFIRVDIVFRTEISRRHFRMQDADDDTVGLEMEFEVTTYSRWQTKDDWEQTDNYTGSCTRWGELKQRNNVTIGDLTLKRVYAGDLENGWSDIQLDDGPNSGRTDLLAIALDAYFSSELPDLPVTLPATREDALNMSWPNSAAFSRWNGPDFSAVTLCYHQNPDAITPFDDYILHHDRNMAFGINADLLEQKIHDELPPMPIEETGVRIDEFVIGWRPGVIELTANGSVGVWLAKVPVTYTAEINVTITNGQLEASLSNTSLALPWWLWVLNGLLFGISGIVVTAVANVIGGNAVDNQVDNIDINGNLSDLISSLTDNTDGFVQIDSVGVGAPGLFLRGNIL